MMRSCRKAAGCSAGLSERIDGSRSRVPMGELKIGETASARSAVCTNDLVGDPRFVDKAWIAANALTTIAGSEAARLLQTSRATLQYKMKLHGL